jgi:hypothetical protein
MKKERRIEIRVGVPAFFALELEDVYKRTSGAHRALAFPNFVGMLIDLGLDQYRKENTTAPIGKDEAPEKESREMTIPLFDLAPESLPDLFRDFDMESRKAREEPGFKIIYPEDFNE